MDLSGIKVRRGLARPYGVSSREEGLNFAVFSQHAARAYLCFFSKESEKPLLEIPLDAAKNRTGGVWHALILGLPEGLFYAYRFEGPYQPKKGFLYNSEMYLVDPYAKSILSSSKWGEPHYTQTASNKSKAPRCPTLLTVPFDWENDKPPRVPFKDLIIYEMHARGFTRHPSSKVSKPGTFQGLMEKIPYLKELGVSAVELMPIHEFDESENPNVNPETKEKLYNYWGYSTINFFSLMNRYGTSDIPEKTIVEFKTLVKEFHRNGIEVILDVVFNHTNEGGDPNYYLSYRGIDNSVYYLLNERGEYQNLSGCGNTVNCNHPVIRELILESLRYWVTEMHVDGFRFDLASILTRDEKGRPMKNPPFIETISRDPILSETKLIAEAWDPGGLYLVGHFPSWGRWAEWNGKFRDTTRNFIAGHDNAIGAFASRLCGSEDLYGKDRKPYHSINFVTAHDGFTLRDLVTYEHKRNWNNAEDNRDGCNYNANWNCGVEGPSDDPKIEALRFRQMKNHIVALMSALGTPMIFMGDEYGHTAKGNNNPWCQDNELSWFLWEQAGKNQDLVRFFKLMIKFRKAHSMIRSKEFLTEGDIEWHGVEPLQINWLPGDHFLAFTLKEHQEGKDIYIAFNAYHENLEITLPQPPSSKKWRRIADTNLPSPDDISEDWEKAQPIDQKYNMISHSAIILKAF